MNAATQSNVTTFKSYSEKSKAKRALKGKVDDNLIDAVLVQEDGKWGFHLNADGTVAGANTVDQDGQEDTQEASQETSANSEEETPIVHDAFSKFAMGQLMAPEAGTEAQAERTTSTRNTGRIEKNRPEQNGVKRPSEGGLCRAVWDACDAMREAHGEVTAKMVKAKAEVNGWNQNNASIEFYQWRKFNGITKAAK